MASDFVITSDKAKDLGLKRSNNEDYVDLFEPAEADELLHSGRLYIVADGVGGAAKGEKASQYATQKVLFEFYSDPDPDVGARLKRAMRLAGNDIFEHAERNEIPKRMATTMVAANVRNGVLTVANVGDSRAYLLRGGRAQQITRDHTIVGEMLRDGEIDEEEALRVRGRNRLMRSLGGERDVQVDIFQEILQPGDRVLLCTDGLARYTVSDDIAKLASEGSPAEIVKRCIDYANQQGGVDNVTVAVIEVGEPTTEPATHGVGASVAPRPVDWDEMVTEPSVTPIARRRKRTRLTRNQQVVLSVLGAVVVMALALGGLLLATGNAADVPTPTSEPVPTLTLSTPTTTRVAVPTLAPTVKPAFPSTSIQPTGHITDLLASELRLSSTLAYTNPFEGPGSWEEVTNKSYVTATINDGRLVVTDINDGIVEWASNIELQNTPVFTDVFAEVTGRFAGTCQGKDGLGLVIHTGKLENAGYETKGYAVEVSCDGYYRVRKFFPEGASIKDTPLQGWTRSSDIVTETGSRNRVGLAIVGEALYALINGIPQNPNPIVDTDNPYVSGGFGLYANAQETPELTVEFDDVEAYGLSRLP